MTFSVRFTQKFLRHIKDAKKRQDAVLEQAMRDIVDAPYTAHGSHPLKEDWAGFRGADFDGADRFVFRVCEECVQKHQETLKPLNCCSDANADKCCVTFVAFGDYHKTAGKRRLKPESSYVIAELDASNQAEKDSEPEPPSSSPKSATPDQPAETSP